MSGSPISRPMGAAMTAVAALAGIFAVTWFFWPEPTEAETIACFIEETGTWENPNARPGDVSRVQVESACEGSRLVHRVRVHTKCAPRDCSWGWTQGVEKSAGHFVATFSTFSAYRYFRMDVSGDRAKVSVTYDFHDDRKPDEVGSFNLRRDD